MIVRRPNNGALRIAGDPELSPEEPPDFDDTWPVDYDAPDDGIDWDGLDPCTDLANAHRLESKHGPDLRHTRSLGWLVYDGARFEVDATGAAERRVHDVAREILIDASAALKAAAKEKNDERREKLEKEARRLLGWAKSSQQKNKIEAALAVACSLETIACNPAAFDVEPDLLNVSNGTVDLRSGALRPHSRADNLTKLAPHAVADDATCPTWVAFLDRIFGGDAELIGFIQRAIGYSLTGSTAEQCFFICHGTGANGKSTLLEALRYVLGDYALTSPTDTFLRTKERGTENDVARLRGARFVAAVESGEGRRLDEERIKRLTGTDTVTARFLYREHFEFAPVCKIWLAVNDRPEIAGVDHGIWRRVRLIPFDVTIPPEEQDPELPAKLRSEASGILKWALEGCKQWRSGGLQAPDVVCAATSAWQGEANQVAQFLAEQCTRCTMQTKKGRMYEAYQAWTKAQGEEPMSAKMFGKRMLALGIEEGRSTSGRFWKGLSVQNEE